MFPRGANLFAGAKRITVILCAVFLLFYFLPVFRVVPLEVVREDAAARQFDPVKYVADFWQEALLPKASSAVSLDAVLEAHEQDPQKAAQTYGHKLGVSPRAYYMVAVEGEVTGVTDGEVKVALSTNEDTAVLIEIGPVFGNIIRDASGLLDIGDFENTQQFNAVSAELNARVEKQVLPQVAEGAAVGEVIKLVGGIELYDRSKVPAKLYLTPVAVEFGS